MQSGQLVKDFVEESFSLVMKSKREQASERPPAAERQHILDCDEQHQHLSPKCCSESCWCKSAGDKVLAGDSTCCPDCGATGDWLHLICYKCSTLHRVAEAIGRHFQNRLGALLKVASSNDSGPSDEDLLGYVTALLRTVSAFEHSAEPQANFLQEVRPEDRPSCHVCGSAMIRTFYCTSCAAITSPTAPEAKETAIPLWLKLFQLCSRYDTREFFWWRCDAEYAPVTFFINCNDEFAWGCADCETLTEENFPVLEKAFADCYATNSTGEVYAGELFCARIRKMRPQGACYKHYPKELWPLFDACGPARETDILNPVKHPGEKETTMPQEQQDRCQCPVPLVGPLGGQCGRCDKYSDGSAGNPGQAADGATSQRSSDSRSGPNTPEQARRAREWLMRRYDIEKLRKSMEVIPEWLAAYGAEIEKPLRKEIEQLRFSLYYFPDHKGSDHTSACSIWREDGLGNAKGFEGSRGPCNCGALENFERRRANRLEQQLATAREEVAKYNKSQLVQDRDEYRRRAETAESLLRQLRGRPYCPVCLRDVFRDMAQSPEERWRHDGGGDVACTQNVCQPKDPITEARAEERQRCAEAVCAYCRNPKHWKPAHDHNGKWMHAPTVYCQAWAIWSLPEIAQAIEVVEGTHPAKKTGEE